MPPSCSPGVSLPLQSGSALVLCWLNVLGAHKLLLLMFAFIFVSDVKPSWETRPSCTWWGFYSAAFFFFFPLFPPDHSVLINDLRTYRKLLRPAWPRGRKRKQPSGTSLVQKFLFIRSDSAKNDGNVLVVLPRAVLVLTGRCRERGKSVLQVVSSSAPHLHKLHTYWKVFWGLY